MSTFKEGLFLQVMPGVREKKPVVEEEEIPQTAQYLGWVFDPEDAEGDAVFGVYAVYPVWSDPDSSNLAWCRLVFVPEVP